MCEQADRRASSALEVKALRPPATVDGHERRPLSGSPAQILDDIATYQKLGVGELIFDFRTDDLTQSLDRMERFSATIMRR